ncbi:MAG: hypothetical protein ACK559_40995, partial [bacterium]
MTSGARSEGAGEGGPGAGGHQRELQPRALRGQRGQAGGAEGRPCAHELTGCGADRRDHQDRAEHAGRVGEGQRQHRPAQGAHGDP